MNKPELPNQTGSNPSLCRWCDKPLEPGLSLNNLVCVTCYRLLVKAGLTDEAIFKRKIADSHKKKKDKNE